VSVPTSESTTVAEVRVTDSVVFGRGVLVLMAGPCVIESLEHSLMLGRAIAGHFDRQHHFAFEAAAWYWHFVDVVWLFLFVTIYWWGGH